MKQNISPELLKAYVFCQSETEAIQLLEEHPELDEYAIPMVAVMEALNRLLQVESIVSEDRGETVVELYDLPAEGVSRAMEQGAAAGISRWIPVVLSVGRTIPLFLTEKAWALLGILAEGIEDPDLREKSSRYHAALRNCLDEGFDEGWARRERDDGLGDDEESQTMLREFGELRDLLLAQSPYAINGNIVSLALDLPTVAASQVDRSPASNRLPDRRFTWRLPAAAPHRGSVVRRRASCIPG